MTDIPTLLARSQAVYQQAIQVYQPYAVVMMFSGGSDSSAAKKAAELLGIPMTHLIHGRTGTGIPETTDHARWVGSTSGLIYLEADAGTAYEDYVLRKGFYGRGEGAHAFAYHTLKHQQFRKAIGTIRLRKRNRPILLLNGARSQESAARGRKIPDPIRAEGNNIWVSLIHDWSAVEKKDFLAETETPMNPVTQTLCRSGECMCGTTQNAESRREAAYWYPHWGRWLDGLEARVTRRFPWKWGDNPPSWFTQIHHGQTTLGEDFMPMCHSCINGADDEVKP